MKVIDQSGWQRSLGMRKGGREISKEQRQLDGIGQAMPLATKGEGWRTPHTTPLKPVALSNCNKYLKQHLRVGPSAAKTQVRGNVHHLRMLFWLLGLDCWHPRYRSCTTRHIYQPAALLPLSTTMVAATGSHQHPQAECFPLFWKKNSHFYCFILHSLTQCDSVIPPGFISWTPFARAWGKSGVTNELFCVAAGQRGGKG